MTTNSAMPPDAERLLARARSEGLATPTGQAFAVALIKIAAEMQSQGSRLREEIANLAEIVGNLKR